MDAVEEIKSRVDIEQLVGERVDLRRSGTALKGLCPFHTEKTPSFFVFPTSGNYKCFGCGQGGDIFTFVETSEKVEFRDALKLLAERAGVELPDERERQRAVEENARLFQANEAAVEFFREQLKRPEGKPAQTYLHKRKLSAPLQVTFGLGYAPEGRHGLHQALTARGFSDGELVSAGLVFPGDDGARPRDRFHGRLMFPIRDARGRVTGFGGRLMGDGEPKYLNSPQTEIFDKSRSVFAIEHAQETIRQGRRAVVVEGYIDAIRAHEAGFKDVVASLGTAITTQQLQTCARLAPTVVLALDPDPAGQTAAVRAGLAALAALPRRQRQLPDSMGRRMVDVGLSVDLRIARIPEGAGDPDELIQRDPTEWERIIESSVPAFEFFFDTVVNAIDRTDDNWRQDVIERVMPVIQEFSFAIGTQAAWVERLGEVTGVQPRLLQNRLTPGEGPAPALRPSRGSRRPSRTPAPPPTPARIVDQVVEAENSLVRILIRHPVPEDLVPALSEIASRRSEVNELVERVVLHAGSGRRPNVSGVGPEAASLAERLNAQSGDELRDNQIAPAVRLHIASLLLIGAKNRLGDLQGFLSQIGVEDAETGLKALHGLLEEKNALEHQIADLQKLVISGV